MHTVSRLSTYKTQRYHGHPLGGSSPTTFGLQKSGQEVSGLVSIPVRRDIFAVGKSACIQQKDDQNIESMLSDTLSPPLFTAAKLAARREKSAETGLKIASEGRIWGNLECLS